MDSIIEILPPPPSSSSSEFKKHNPIKCDIFGDSFTYSEEYAAQITLSNFLRQKMFDKVKKLYEDNEDDNEHKKHINKILETNNTPVITDILTYNFQMLIFGTSKERAVLLTTTDLKRIASFKFDTVRDPSIEVCPILFPSRFMSRSGWGDPQLISNRTFRYPKAPVVFHIPIVASVIYKDSAKNNFVSQPSGPLICIDENLKQKMQSTLQDDIGDTFELKNVPDFAFINYGAKKNSDTMVCMGKIVDGECHPIDKFFNVSSLDGYNDPLYHLLLSNTGLMYTTSLNEIMPSVLHPNFKRDDDMTREEIDYIITQINNINEFIEAVHKECAEGGEQLEKKTYDYGIVTNELKMVSVVYRTWVSNKLENKDQMLKCLEETKTEFTTSLKNRKTRLSHLEKLSPNQIWIAQVQVSQVEIGNSDTVKLSVIKLIQTKYILSDNGTEQDFLSENLLGPRHDSNSTPKGQPPTKRLKK